MILLIISLGGSLSSWILLFFCFPFAFFLLIWYLCFMFYMPFLLLFFGCLCFSVLYISFLLPFCCFFCIFGFLCSERARGRLRSNRGRFKTKEGLATPQLIGGRWFCLSFLLGVPFPHGCFFSFVFPLPFFPCVSVSLLLCSICPFYCFFGYLCFSVLYIFFLLPFCCFFCIFGFLFYVFFLAGGRLRKGQRKVEKQQR